MTGTCPSCAEHDAREWTVCRACAGHLERNLGDLPALIGELDTTLSRQTATGGRTGARSTTKPLAFDVRASAVLGEVKSTLVGWVRVLAEDGGDTWPDDTAEACARWLLARICALRTHPAAGDIATEIADLHKAAGKAIDRNADRWFAGPCDQCGAVLYGRPHQPKVRCKAAGCGAEYDTADRRAVLCEAAQDYLLTIPEMMRALPGLTGQGLSDATMRTWRHRGRLVSHGTTPLGRDLFRVGDVLDLVQDAAARRTAG